MKKRKPYFLIPFLLFSGCEEENTNGNIPVDDNLTHVELTSFYDGLKDSTYEILVSEDGTYILYSIPEGGKTSDLHLYNTETEEHTVITDNEYYIEFDIAVDDAGNFAYLLHDRSQSYPQVYLNGDMLTGVPSDLRLHSCILFENTLFFLGDNSVSGKSKIFSYDIENKDLVSADLEQMVYGFHIVDSHFYLIGQSMESYQYEVVKLSSDLEHRTMIYQSEFPCFMVSSSQETPNIIQVQSENDGIYLWNAYMWYYKSQINNTFSLSNNFSGRLTWNVTYRIKGMLELYLKTKDPNIKEDLIESCHNLILQTNNNMELPIDNKDDFLWATKVYGLDTSQSIDLLVSNATILDALLEVLMVGDILDKETEEKIIDLAESVYLYFEEDYADGFYKFRKDIHFWSDGVKLPFNQQNIFGSVLCKLYEITKEEQYKERAFALAESFQKEFVYTETGSLIWHYWFYDFYQGWEESDNISTNTPSRKAATTILYEDLSHASLNVEFILNFIETFGEEVFTYEDVLKLSHTIDGFILDGTLSGYIDGDIQYQAPSYFRYCGYKWTDLDNATLKERFRNYFDYYPEWDSQSHLYSYANYLEDYLNASIQIQAISLDGEEVVVSHLKSEEISLFIQEKLLF